MAARARHRAAVHRHASPRSNAISRVIAPPLHSASLRSYVMVIVVTTLVVGGAALVDGSAIRRVRPGDERAAPRGAGRRRHHRRRASRAALAKSTMAAVLSLGVVGYGVATTFLLFGAPDLAMTQFSVETLTVLIYVLVFRHFRNLGALSPPLVRVPGRLHCGGDRHAHRRVGAVGLDAPRRRRGCASTSPSSVRRSATDATSSTSSWSISAAFDTMGEITVLATAAIGVRALAAAWRAPSARDRRIAGGAAARRRQSSGPPLAS